VITRTRQAYGNGAVSVRLSVRASEVTTLWRYTNLFIIIAHGSNERRVGRANVVGVPVQTALQLSVAS